MADKQPIKAVFQRLGSDHKTRTRPHLRPLSVYSRMITCGDTGASSGAASWVPNSPFCNLKIEIPNRNPSIGRKRQLDDSCLDETYETPPKKMCLSCHSPDLACVLDSPLPDEKNGTAESSVVVEELNKRNSSSTNNENSSDLKVQPPLKSAGLLWTDSSNESSGQSSPSLSLSDIQSSSSPIGDLGHAFDFDVDDIMCLSPIDRDEEQPLRNGLGDFFQSCKTFCGKQKSSETSGACEGQKYPISKLVQGKVEGHGGKDIGMKSDEGYFTNSFKMATLTASKNETPPVSQTSSPVMSTPLEKLAQLVKWSPLTNQLRKAEQASPVVQQESLKASSPLCLNGSMNLEFCNTIPKMFWLDSTEDEKCEISVGTLIQKSLVCDSGHHSSVVADTDIQIKESKDEPSASHQMEPMFQVSLLEETFSAESLESTPPLKVQVKSKVVLPISRRPDIKSKPAGKEATANTQQPAIKPRSKDKKHHAHVHRPVVFLNEEDWEREKTVYVDSVIRHMTDDARAEDGVMTELWHLMDSVATQGNGNQWKHPSDLTHRNYQPDNSGPLFSLDEWQDLNYPTHRRFAHVPQPFRRSSVL